MRSEKSNPALHGRRIVLGISGGVAAFKAVYLARRLIEAGCTVKALMTAGALKFVGAQSLAAITGNPVTTSLFGQASVSPHTELAGWADAIVVAPATANIIAKVSQGLSDDALAATILAFEGPVAMAPAMHTEMWQQPATQRNIEQLVRDGRRVIGPTSGALAGGDVGEGRMVEPEEIVAAVAEMFDSTLAGLTVLVTAGGTREPIDPVRYIGNRSSGKMGHAVADEAARRGARVLLVTTSSVDVLDAVEVVRVESAAEMAEAVWSRADGVDVAVLAAAVADFRPSSPADTKLARTDGPPQIPLEPTPNVLAGLVERIGGTATIVGFAAETGSLDRAVDKATTYGLNLLVANDVSKPESGFGTDTNEVSLVSPDGTVEPLELMSKLGVAQAIWNRVTDLRRKPPPGR